MEVAADVHALGHDAMEAEQVAVEKVDALGVVNRAVERHPVGQRKAVLGNDDGELVALGEELGAPVERVVGALPQEVGVGKAGRDRGDDGLALRAGDGGRGRVDVAAVEIEGLLDGLEVGVAEARGVFAVGAQAVLGVGAEDGRVAPPAVVPAVVRPDGVHAGVGGGDVLRRVADRVVHGADGGPADDGAGLSAGADGPHREAVGEQGVVPGLQDLAQAELQARRVLAGEVAHADEALGLVQRDPVRDAVGEAVHHDGGVFGKPLRAVGVEPAAAQEELARKIPVEKRDPRRDAGGEQLVHQTVVETEAGRADLADAGGEHARPGDGETVGLQADLAHERDVLRVAAVVVAGDVAVVAFPDASLLMGKHVPDGVALAVGVARAFDLIGRRGGAPDKAGRKGGVVGHGSRLRAGKAAWAEPGEGDAV